MYFDNVKVQQTQEKTKSNKRKERKKKCSNVNTLICKM